MIKSYSKVNLFLRVLKKNSNKLHNIQSSVMLLDLHDRISIKSTSKKKDEINFVGQFKSNINKNNTITKSLRKPPIDLCSSLSFKEFAPCSSEKEETRAWG